MEKGARGVPGTFSSSKSHEGVGVEARGGVVLRIYIEHVFYAVGLQPQHRLHRWS